MNRREPIARALRVSAASIFAVTMPIAAATCLVHRLESPVAQGVCAVILVLALLTWSVGAFLGWWRDTWLREAGIADGPTGTTPAEG